jgi:ribonuclease VapC
MFLDASAIVAVLNREPGWNRLREKLDAAERVAVSPTVKFEAVLALTRIRAAHSGKAREAAMVKVVESVEAMLAACDAREISITPDIGRLAIDASAKFGRGSAHRAKLNFGDCLAYACAKSLRGPLLFVGKDFTHTDIGRA